MVEVSQARGAVFGGGGVRGRGGVGIKKRVSSEMVYGLMCLGSRRKRLTRLIATRRDRSGQGREEQDRCTWCSSWCTEVTD